MHLKYFRENWGWWTCNFIYLNRFQVRVRFLVLIFVPGSNSILNILSHDLAGPLGMIGNMANLLQSDLKSHQDQAVHNLIRLIQRSSQQGVQLIQEFMKQEFLESANVDLIKRRIDLV